MNTSNQPSGLANQSGLHLHRELTNPRLFADAIYLDQIVGRGLQHTRSVQAPGDLSLVEAIEGLGPVLCADRADARREWVIEIGDCIALIALSRESVDANVAAPTGDSLERCVARITAMLRPEGSDERVWITFWASDGEGRIRAVARRVQMPTWDEVEADHPAASRAALGELAARERPTGGSLILWHGPPGTGKTHAVRALCRDWQPWCAPHFITDPERFLGDASYLMRVLTSCDPDNIRDRDWRLLILEDSGELLTADARERTGQALSRLLNATDGLLGQSANTLLLVTTNEPVGKLHPALVRHGRCLSEIEFGPLPVAEANAWLAANGSPVAVTTPTVIADLYAITAGRGEPPPERRIGFAAA